MASMQGIEERLGKLYQELKVPSLLIENLKREHCITTVESLIEQRLKLFDMVVDDISPDIARLLSSVDYIIARQKLGDKNVSIDPLFDSAKKFSYSFAYFNCKFINTKALCVQRQANETHKSRKTTSSKFFITDRDENDWKKEVVEISDDEVDKKSLCKELGIGQADSAWELDSSLRNVQLRDDAMKLVIPVPLFRKLYAHQRQGIEWMAGRRMARTGGILGDEMGMGKTLQSLTFLLCLMNSKTIKSALVVCPNAIVRTTWRNEALGLLKYFGLDCNIQVKVITADMPELQRTKLLCAAKNCKVEMPYLIIVPYSTFRLRLPRGFKPLKKEFDYVVLDEAHKAKNKNSNTTRNLQKVIGTQSHILMLTGTPLMNRLEELYRILTLAAGPSLLGKWEHFRSHFVKPIEAARQRTATEYELTRGCKLLKELQEKIKESVLMRKRKDHLKDIVPINREWDCWCALSPKQRSIYNYYLKSEDANVQGILEGNHKCVLPVIGKLRLICGHPLLSSRGNVLERCEQMGADKRTAAAKVVADSPKMELLLDILKASCEKGNRCLVFTHFIDMLDIMSFVLAETDGINACRIDGKTSAKPKKLEKIVNDFNSEASLFNVMLVSIKAGGEGLTLTGANICIVYDPVWSQAESDQAVARICRPGQKQECQSFYLIAAGTIEEKMFGKQVYKGLMGRTVLGARTRKDSIAVTDARLYNKDELSQLFELEPHGVCKTIERLKLPNGGELMGAGCIVSKKHKSVVALTRRSAIYNSSKRKAEDGNDNEDDDFESSDVKNSKKLKYGTGSATSVAKWRTQKMPARKSDLPTIVDDEASSLTTDQEEKTHAFDTWTGFATEASVIADDSKNLPSSTGTQFAFEFKMDQATGPGEQDFWFAVTGRDKEMISQAGPATEASMEANKLECAETQAVISNEKSEDDNIPSSEQDDESHEVLNMAEPVAI